LTWAGTKRRFQRETLGLQRSGDANSTPPKSQEELPRIPNGKALKPIQEATRKLLSDAHHTANQGTCPLGCKIQWPRYLSTWFGHISPPWWVTWQEASIKSGLKCNSRESHPSDQKPQKSQEKSLGIEMNQGQKIDPQRHGQRLNAINQEKGLTS
jgi:hypothetical protein